MAALNIALMILITGELLILCSNLSKIKVDLTERHEKLTSELSEIKSSLKK